MPEEDWHIIDSKYLLTKNLRQTEGVCDTNMFVDKLVMSGIIVLIFYD